MNDLLLAAAVITGAVLLTVMLVLIMRNDKKQAAVKRWRPGAAGKNENDNRTDADAPPEKSNVCGICFGAISAVDTSARCKCGQAFHDACAQPTGACPYCKRPYDDLEKELPDCMTCPLCGIVISRDGTFICKCGNIVNAGENVCGACGTEYLCGKR